MLKLLRKRNNIYRRYMTISVGVPEVQNWRRRQGFMRVWGELRKVGPEPKSAPDVGRALGRVLREYYLLFYSQDTCR